jgi:DNA uptake protein ComE-like DNA-binding protein
MKLFHPKSPFENRHGQHGSVLIIVLWIAIGLVSIALYFANSMTFELRASDNRASGLATDQAVEGAARYISYVLANYATNGAVPSNTMFSCEAVPVGDAHFWIIGRDPDGTSSSDPSFGLIDEGSKLNLNTAGTNTLYSLPNMTADFANAIVDWRSTNGSGEYSLNYGNLGYEDKNAPFETVDELRLVYGATIDLLVGDDVNRNGVLDANEKSSAGGTTPNYGLLEYTTIYNREPNFHSDGTLLTNVNTASPSQLQSLFQNAGISSAKSIADSIYTQIHQPAGQPNNYCASILDFALRCMKLGMSADNFAKIYNNVTTTTNLYSYGRLNINTANEAVLTARFMGANIDEQTANGAAQSLISYREQNPNNLSSPAWMITALGQNNNVVTALVDHDWITTKSFQFTADIAAVGPFGRGYRRVKFVFDTSDGTPKIIYRQDLSRLGWALGEKARETWVVKETQ